MEKFLISSAKAKPPPVKKAKLKQTQTEAEIAASRRQYDQQKRVREFQKPWLFKFQWLVFEALPDSGTSNTATGTGDTGVTVSCNKPDLYII